MVDRADFYDVFLSHHSADKPVVEALACRLHDEEHVRPFFDVWDLIPGDAWQAALEKALEASQTCAVFIGPHGLGPWQEAEMRMALSKHVTHHTFRVFPVFLPGTTVTHETLPPLLAGLTSVDFRSAEGINDSTAFKRLVAGIRGERPGHAGSCRQRPPHPCPAPGAQEVEATPAPVVGRGAARTWTVLHGLTQYRWTRRVVAGAVCLAGAWAVSALPERFAPVSDDMYGRVEATDLTDLPVELLNTRGERILAGSGAVDSVAETCVLWYSRWQRPQQFRLVAPGCQPQTYEIEPTHLRTGRGITLSFLCQEGS